MLIGIYTKTGKCVSAKKIPLPALYIRTYRTDGEFEDVVTTDMQLDSTTECDYSSNDENQMVMERNELVLKYSHRSTSPVPMDSQLFPQSHSSNNDNASEVDVSSTDPSGSNVSFQPSSNLTKAAQDINLCKTSIGQHLSEIIGSDPNVKKYDLRCKLKKVHNPHGNLKLEYCRLRAEMKKLEIAYKAASRTIQLWEEDQLTIPLHHTNKPQSIQIALRTQKLCYTVLHHEWKED